MWYCTKIETKGGTGGASLIVAWELPWAPRLDRIEIGVPIAQEDAIRPLLGSHQDALSLALAGEAIFSHHRSGRLIGQDDEEINVHQKSPSPEWEGNPDDMAATYSRVGLR